MLASCRKDKPESVGGLVEDLIWPSCYASINISVYANNALSVISILDTHVWLVDRS